MALSGQLGANQIGRFALGSAGPGGLQQARINSFTATPPGPVAPGTSVLLAWTTSFGVVTLNSVTVTANGSTTVNPTVTTAYTLVANDGVNPPQSQTITITILAVGSFVRAAAGVSTLGVMATVGLQLDLGDLVIVGATSGTQNGANDLSVTDNLGNTYLVAIQGIADDFGQSGHAGDAQIAYTVVTHPGVATITNTSGDASAMTQVSAAEYIIPAGMTLDQVGYWIGGIVVPNPATDDGVGTEPVQYSNSLLITLMRNGGFCMMYNSLDGDNKRTEIAGVAVGGHGAGGHALFDAILVGPGIRNSNVYVTPNPQPSCSPASRSGLSNILTAVFSVPLPRPANLASQGGVRPGKSAVLGVYNGQTAIDVSLPYMPRIGSIVLVGCSTGYAGGVNPVPVFTVGDPYGNVYTQIGTDSSAGRLEADAVFITTVAHLPATGVFHATMSVPPFPDPSGAAGNPKLATIGEYFLNSPGTPQVAGFASSTNLGGGLMKLLTTTLTVPANTMMAGFGTGRYTVGSPLPVAWTQSGSFSVDISSDLWQVDANALSQSTRLGTGDWFHFYPPTAGAYAGETQGTLSGGEGIMVVAIPFTPGSPGGPLTLACPVGGGTATVGVFYSVTMVPSGGTPPYSNFHVVSGSLPPGLTLNSASGVISGIPTTPGTYTFTIEVTDSTGATARITCMIVVPATASTFMLIYPVNYRELDTAFQIASAGPIHTSYTGRLIATDHTRKWTRWNAPAVGGALMYRQPGKIEPIFFIGGNVYALRADLLTDDDLGLIVPYYTTYFFVTHDAEMGLTYVDATGDRQPLGSGRKLLAYLKAYIAAQNTQAPGTCQLVITPFVDNLQNPWALIGLRTLVNKPKFDLEWPGGQVQGDRIALKFASVPITGTDNGFSLQRLTAFLKRAQRLQIRGAN